MSEEKQWREAKQSVLVLKKKKALLKYIDQNNLAEIKLLEVLRSMKDI